MVGPWQLQTSSYSRRGPKFLSPRQTLRRWRLRHYLAGPQRGNPAGEAVSCQVEDSGTPPNILLKSQASAPKSGRNLPDSTVKLPSPLNSSFHRYSMNLWQGEEANHINLIIKPFLYLKTTIKYSLSQGLPASLKTKEVLYSRPSHPSRKRIPGPGWRGPGESCDFSQLRAKLATPQLQSLS